MFGGITSLKLKLAEGFCRQFEPCLGSLSEASNVAIYSFARRIFEKLFVKYDLKQNVFTSDSCFTKKLWGIKFRIPICNSAGMFKNGNGYDLVAKLGAGAYVGGTSTFNQRLGNTKSNIYLPFVKLPKSKISINYLGLPNLGDEILSRKLYTKNKVDGCPIGWSVMRSPDFSINEAQEKLVQSLFLYQNNNLIDFIEINESCPNVKQGCGDILARLDYISEQFLKKRSRHLPVVIKLSNDICEYTLIEILQSLVRLGFDGVNLGNTSTNYNNVKESLDDTEVKLYDYFTKNFGGGVGGRVLKSKSLELCKIAVNELKKIETKNEFHIIRTGGIEDFGDIQDSLECGISMNQWLTGFYFSFLKEGNNVYKNMLENKQFRSYL
jgi:dihydroorotate dehydrogenase